MRKIQIIGLGALLLSAALALAAGNPTLEITSPTNNATVQPTPGLGNAVLIKFKTHDFKIVKSSDTLNAPTASQAQGAGTDMGAAEQNPSMGGNPSATSPRNAGGMSPSENPSAGMPADSSTMPQGAPAASANPHEGQIRVLVDDSHWYFIHSSNDPIILAGFQPGQHRVAMQLVSSDHRPVSQPQQVTFTIAGSAAPTK
jgi:hypothetical protein